MAHYQMLMPGQAFSEFNLGISLDMKELVDLFAPPVHLPSPLPLHVVVDSDPDLSLLSAVRSLTGRTDGPSSSSEADEVSEADVRAAIEDAYAMRSRVIVEGRLLREVNAERVRVSMASTLSALEALPWPPPLPAPDPGSPHRHKRRRILPPQSKPPQVPTATVTVPLRSRPPPGPGLADAGTGRLGATTTSGNGASGNALPEEQQLPERTSRLGRKRVLTAGQRKANHIQSEQNRRAKIREACDMLCTTIGEPPSASRSEEVVIQKTIEHVQHMLSKQASLLQRLHDARAARSIPISIAASTGAVAKWERQWDGGAVDDGEGSDHDASGNDE